MNKVMYNFLWLLVSFFPGLTFANDSHSATDIEIKSYQQRIYDQKDLIKKLDEEISTLKNQLQVEVAHNQELVTKLSVEKRQKENLNSQVIELSRVQQTLQQTNQMQNAQLKAQANQVAICQQNQQQCLYQMQSLTQQLQAINVYRNK